MATIRRESSVEQQLGNIAEGQLPEGFRIELLPADGTLTITDWSNDNAIEMTWATFDQIAREVRLLRSDQPSLDVIQAEPDAVARSPYISGDDRR